MFLAHITVLRALLRGAVVGLCTAIAEIAYRYHTIVRRNT